MERFEELKKIILERAREAHACREQYGRAYMAENFQQLMEVVRDNFCWAVNNSVIDGALIDTYRDEFNAGKIWHNEDVTDGFLLASGNATVRAYGNSTVEAYGNSTVEAYDNSTVRACGNATVRAYDNSTVEAYGNSYVTSYDMLQCKISDHAISRICKTNTIHYSDPEMKFERVESMGEDGL